MLYAQGLGRKEHGQTSKNEESLIRELFTKVWPVLGIPVGRVQ